jgi:hypothetical protein
MGYNLTNVLRAVCEPHDLMFVRCPNYVAVEGFLPASNSTDIPFRPAPLSHFRSIFTSSPLTRRLVLHITEC